MSGVLRLREKGLIFLRLFCDCLIGRRQRKAACAEERRFVRIRIVTKKGVMSYRSIRPYILVIELYCV